MNGKWDWPALPASYFDEILAAMIESVDAGRERALQIALKGFTVAELAEASQQGRLLSVVFTDDDPRIEYRFDGQLVVVERRLQDVIDFDIYQIRGN